MSYESRRVDLLGPFPIAFDDAGLVNPLNAGVELGPEIEAGSIIQAAWIADTGTRWLADPDSWLQIAFGSAANATQIVTIDGDSSNLDPRGLQPFPLSDVVEANLVPWVAAVSGRLVVSWNDVTSPASGEGHVYALVVTAE